MRGVVIFVVGVAVGAIGMWYGPKNLQHTAQKGAAAAVEMAEEQRYDACQADFFRETQCLQRKPQGTCAKELETKCGTPPGDH